MNYLTQLGTLGLLSIFILFSSCWQNIDNPQLEENPENSDIVLYKPTALSPTQGEVLCDVTPSFSWECQDADGDTIQGDENVYVLQICSDSSFNSEDFIVHEIVTTRTTYSLDSDESIDTLYEATIPEYFSTVFYWRVKSMVGEYDSETETWSYVKEDGEELESEWSNNGSFITGELDTISDVTLDDPSGDTVCGDTITFTWNKTCAATEYKIELTSDTGFNFTYTGIVSDSFILDTSDLTSDEEYDWRVAAITIDAQTDTANETWSTTPKTFTFKNPIAPPNAVSPEPGETDVVSPPMYEWSDVAAAKYYHIQISSAANFETILDEEQSIFHTGQQYYNADASYTSGETYYWRVRSKDISCEGAWSGVYSFTVQ